MNFKRYILSYILQSLLITYNLIYITCEPVHGRYTRNVEDYQLVIPRKLNTYKEFLTYQLPHFFEYNRNQAREKRSINSPNLYYGLTFNNHHYYIELWPNPMFVSPDLVFEKRSPKEKPDKHNFYHIGNSLCYYHGKVQNNTHSKVAMSTCNGLAGYIYLDGNRYYIEPVAEHTPNKRGHHLHVLHLWNNNTKNRREADYTCATTDSWEDAWKKRFFDESHCNKNSLSRKRGLESVHRYLETLVVVDKRFIHHHKNTDMDTYVMTIMNMVSDFYHDASTGNQMDVVVVRVMYLEKEEEEIDLAISVNASETLNSFCNWQVKVNPKDIEHPNHHDIAILLTRYDICADDAGNCGLMGLAYVAAACTQDKPCAINEDAGLILGIVVAHEMGHIMGCSHDTEEISGCQPQDPSGAYYVMSPFVHVHTNIWSTCSKTFITQLFDHNLGECLNDEPKESIYKDTGMLPGSMYDASYQCNSEFPGSTVCLIDPEKFCKALTCKVSDTSCVTNQEPPADGTKCGENMWCYDGKCIEIGTRPEAVNGGWSDWGPWSSCSRTCGGGVSYSERSCDNPTPNHKGRYCLGERKKFNICNTYPCEEGAISYRAVQCTEYDQKKFRDKFYKWTPFFKEDDPCGLYCINNEHVYSKLSPRVKDGTPCKRGTRNICISGVCRKMGCDYVVDSDAIEDDCGLCRGDGTQCKIVDEVYTGSPGHGYVKVVTIPKGSKKIYVDEQKPSDNTIAVSAVDEKKFYLNGNFIEQQDGDHDIGGVEGVYSHPEPNKESLVIYGPLKEDIVLFVVYYKNENVGYHYKYAELIGDVIYQPHYHWEFVEWEDCSVRCGGGTQTANPECIEAKGGKVSSNFCKDTETPPTKTRTCNEQPCKTKWKIGKWSMCSACKFQSGVRTRQVECIKEAKKPGNDDILVDDVKCPPPKPGTRELCNTYKKCVHPKRERNAIPVDVLQHLWFQTRKEYMLHKPMSLKDFSNSRTLRKARRNITKRKQNQDYTTQKNGDSPGNVVSKVGEMVDDKIPLDQIKLIELPLKQSHLSFNITDVAFETMGDKIPDIVDTSKKIVFTGKDAATRLKELENKNITNNTDDK